MPRQSLYIYVLGILFILYAAGQSALEIVNNGIVLVAAIDFILVSLLGILFLFVGRWISRTDLDPELYRRIVGWSLAGVGVMFVFLVLRAVHPGVAASFTFGERAIALTLGSIAGLGIGINEARAITREQEVTRRNEELRRTQKVLKQRNEELANIRDELETVVEELEISNERLDHFASTAAHDLQEPLRMITRYLQLLEDRFAEELDDEAIEFLDFAVDGADRLQMMVDDLLEYSRIETQGKQFDSIDLNAILEDVLTDLQVRVEETNADITSETLPRVHGDESQLRQLFQNMVSNALEYCGDQPPRIHISAKKNGKKQEISVQDEGVGIDPKSQKRIFEIFQRLHPVDEHPGSGLGLAICQRIVERHDGDIWVDSILGEGSTFTFTLPAVD